MKRYFFNIKTPSGTIADPEGTPMPSHEKAAELAEASMREMIAHAFYANRRSAKAIRVVDDRGTVVTTIKARQIADGLL